MIIFQKYFVLINKPELKCNGKCHLMKELASEDDKPISSDKKKSSNLFADLFLLQSKFFFSLFSKETIKNSSYTNLYSHLNSSSITTNFHFLIIPYLFVSDSLWQPGSLGASYLRNYKRKKLQLQNENLLYKASLF
jgi:hypothetical protein